MPEFFEVVGLRQEVKLKRLVLANLLHRPAGMEPDVLRQVHGRHAALADDRFEFVSIIDNCNHDVALYVIFYSVNMYSKLS